MERDCDFYVEADCCLLCGVPESIAPEIFETGASHCFVRRQPRSQDEIDLTVKAMWSSEVDCIRYRGCDAALLDRLAMAGLSDQADHPGPPQAQRLCDKVSFAFEIDDTPASAASVASAFRADMRANEKTVLPALLDRKSVWISWFENRFHGVRFSRSDDGRFVAQLRSRSALQGLGWLVDDWLRAIGATDIRWQAKDDPASTSPMPM